MCGPIARCNRPAIAAQILILFVGASSAPALVPPPLELFGLFPEASRSGDEILSLLINIIIFLFKSSSFNAQSHGYSDAYHMIIPELGRIDRSHAAARPLP